MALESHGFSPGVLDGRTGQKLLLATREFQRCRGLPITGQLDGETAKTLRVETDPRNLLKNYTITQADTAKVTGPVNGWVQRSKLKYLGYHSLADALAEKHHCTVALLAGLNKGTKLSSLDVGQVIVVPAVKTSVTTSASQLRIDLNEKTIRAVDKSGRLVGIFPCSIARDPAKRPKGSAHVARNTANPWYSFDPSMWPEVKGIDHKLAIPPGPRNPVGLQWIGLDRPGYGIHGTPNPELIGKTGSHGCFRLTNWDAARLGKMVRPGTPVVVQ